MQEEYAKLRAIIRKNIGLKVKELRLKKGKSITLISNEIDVSKSVWADLEKGIKDPQVTTLWRIAEALEVSLSELISSVEKETPKDKSFIE